MSRTRGRYGALGAIALLVAACSTGGGATGSGTSSAPSNAVSDVPAGPCPTAQPEPLAEGETRLVTIKTARGAIEIIVDGDLSPIAAGNFVALAACGFYDGVVFHRVVPAFVIQGGDGQFGRAAALDRDRMGTGGPGYTIQDEPVTSTYGRGTVAMARSGAPNSVGSQFFIVLTEEARQALADPSYNNYQIIGTVSSGMEAVDAIAAAADAENPTNPVAMDSVTVRTP